MAYSHHSYFIYSLFSLCSIWKDFDYVQGKPGVFSLANMYASNMVLQKEPVHAIIRGYASQINVTVSLRFNSRKYTGETCYDDSGHVSWLFRLEPTPAGGPYTITVSLGDITLILNNVLFGDVWLCNGQSNMEFEINKLRSQESSEVLADTINYPEIRCVTRKQTLRSLSLSY